MDKAELDAQFSALYKAHLRDVYSYSYYRVGNHHDAEDLTEQTFLQAYRHFERALRESDGRPLRPWLIRIAHNLAANHYRDRSRKPQSPLDESSPVATTHTTEDIAEGRDELKRILEGKAPEDPNEKVAAPMPATAAPAGPAAGSEADTEFWEGVKDSDDPEDIALYLETFPPGAFAAEAKKRIEELKG